MSIVCLASTPFYSFPNRLQQMMKWLSQKSRILYFDPPPYKSHGDAAEHSWKDESLQAGKRIDVFATPPISRRMRSGVFFKNMGERKLARFISQRIADYTVGDAVLWITSPEFAGCVEHIPHKGVVFDCHPRFLSGGEKWALELAAKSDLVLASTSFARKTLLSVNPNTILVPNAADYELFHKAADEDLPFPDDLFNVQNPIFGILGRIDETIEFSFIEAAAKKHPEWNFVLAGDILPNTDLSLVEALRNVHFLGNKQQRVLPAYLRRFDVCLNLQKNQDDIGECPISFYEYLATGKPIISTPYLPDVLDYSDVVYLVGTKEEFIDACQKACTERRSWNEKQRIVYAQAASWNARGQEIEKELKKRGLFS